MIRWFRNWRTRRHQAMCERIRRMYPLMLAEVLAELDRDGVQIPDEWKRR